MHPSTIPDDHNADATPLCLDSDGFVGLCRDLLSRGLSVRFVATGQSMRPTLQDRDVLWVEPLRGQLPRVGEVVLYATREGRAVVHRVVAQVGQGADRWVVTSGDLHPPGALDAPVPLSAVLGRVTRCERAGQEVPVVLRRPPWIKRLRGWWAARRRGQGEKTTNQGPR